jgi:hypothetical protein
MYSLIHQGYAASGGEFDPEEIQENRTWSTTHRIGSEDKTAMSAMRLIVEPNKGRLPGTAARVPFDAIKERVAAPAGVTCEAGTVGGVSGFWSRPEDAKPGEAILHIRFWPNA